VPDLGLDLGSHCLEKSLKSEDGAPSDEFTYMEVESLPSEAEQVLYWNTSIAI
jgi:hypothetical protein